MKLIPEKKAVLLNPRHPERLLKIIPTAKKTTYRGQSVIAVPHRLDETRVLNNLGVQVPSPIVREYKWPRSARIEQPFDAQIKTASFLTLNSRAYVLNDMGTGKSLSILWAFDYLRKRNGAQKLLVICPLPTMERTWADEVFFNLNHLETSVVYGDRKRRLKMLDKDADIYIVNHHGAQIIEEALRERHDITHVAIDELAQVGRNKQTDIWKAFNSIVNGSGRKDVPLRSAWSLTATPTPNEPTDAWAQVRLITPERVSPYFSRFRDRVMYQAGPYTWIEKDEAVDVVDKAMSPAVRFRLEDCTDLPPTIYITREAKLTADQQKAYDSMHKDLVAQMESGEILAVNEAVKVGKLVQIACGIVYKDEDEEVIIGAESRLKVVKEAIEESVGKVIVFAPFRSAVEMVSKQLRKTGYTVETIHGGVSKGARDRIFGSFQSAVAPQVLVAQPAAMSHGLNLTRASTIVWYAPVTSNEIYIQANGRIVRPGQKNTTVIINIEGTPVERRMYARLKKKEAMQGLLLARKVHREAA